MPDDPSARLLDLLDASSEETAGTSVRLPVNLREAASVAVALGLAASTAELAIQGLRDVLEAFAQGTILDAHYRQHPETRPSLAEMAIAAARLDGSPLADRPDLVELAAEHLGSVRPDPSPDEVLAFAAGLDLAQLLGGGA